MYLLILGKTHLSPENSEINIRDINHKLTITDKIKLKVIVDNFPQSHKNLNTSFILKKILYTIRRTNIYAHLQSVIDEASIKFNNTDSNEI